MLSLHGTLDTLLPIRNDGDVYARLVGQAGRAGRHRYYRIDAGNHVDDRYDRYPDRLRPILPCQRSAFRVLEAWVEDRSKPPPSHLVEKPVRGEVVNECALAEEPRGARQARRQ